MNDIMAKIKISKTEAARRQIDSAIRMLFINEDPVSIHTLAAAGYGILKDIAEKKGNVDIHQTVKDIIRPGMEKKFWYYMNKPANFFKHADKDPDSVLSDFSEEANEWTLFHACFYFRDLGFTPTPEMNSLISWMSMLHPKFLKDDYPMKEELMRFSGSIANMSREKRLEMGRLFLEKIKKEHKGF